MNAPRPANLSSSTRGYTIALLALTCLGAGLRFYGIDRQSLWSDELFAVMASYAPRFQDIWPLLLDDSHPPGYVTFMYWTLPWIGYSDTAIRLHAFVFGVCWIPLTYWLGQRWLSPRVGLLAAILVTASYPAIYYSQEARAYSMLVAFALLNLVCFLEILLSTSPRPRFTWGFVITATLLLYLHYSGLVWLAAEALVAFTALILYGSSTARFVLYVKLHILPLLLFAPWLGLMLEHMTDRQEWAVSVVPDWRTAAESLRKLLGPHQNVFVAKLVILAFSTGFAVHLLGIRSRRREGLFILIILSLVLLPIAAFYIKSNVGTPIFKSRYFLFAQPLCALILAFGLNAGLERIPGRARPYLFPVMALMVLAAQGFYTLKSGIYTVKTKDPIRSIVEIIKRNTDKNPGVGYTILSSAEWMEHYPIQFGLSVDRHWVDRRYYTANAALAIQQYLEQHPDIQYFYYIYLEEDPQNSASASLQKRYRVIFERDRKNKAGRIKLLKFSAKEAPTPGEFRDTATNPILQTIDWVDAHLRQTRPRHYTTLFTHDYVEYYLEAYRIKFDSGWQGRYHTTAHSLDDLARYLEAHPEIEMFYFLPRNEPELVQLAAQIETRYPLLAQYSSSRLNAYVFSAKRLKK